MKQLFRVWETFLALSSFSPVFPSQSDVCDNITIAFYRHIIDSASSFSSLFHSFFLPFQGSLSLFFFSFFLPLTYSNRSKQAARCSDATWWFQSALRINRGQDYILLNDLIHLSDHNINISFFEKSLSFVSLVTIIFLPLLINFPQLFYSLTN